MNAPEAGPPVLFQPHGLVSLWDMIKLYGAGFSRLLESIQSILWQINLITSMGHYVGANPLKNILDHLIPILKNITQECEKLNIVSCKDSAAFLLSRIESGHAMNGQTLKFSLEQIISLYYNEIEKKDIYYLQPHEMSVLRQGQNLFGSIVAEKFISLIPEMLESSKSYAFERHTACAFHALRCLEAGIRAMARCLGIPDPTRGADRSWAIVLKAIKAEMDRRWPNSGDRMSGDGHVFEDLHAALASMQNPWRNATMHLETSYNREDADSLIHVVKRFMSRLAARMDEDGLPLA